MSEGSDRSAVRIIVAWLLVALCAGFILWLGGDDFGASATHGLIGPLLEWLFPDLSNADRWLLHVRIRKLAHAVEYAVLALLAFRAAFLSFRTKILRVAAVALGIAVSVAAADEARQAASAKRTGSPYDVALDAGGAVAALAFVLSILRFREQSRRREKDDG